MNKKFAFTVYLTNRLFCHNIWKGWSSVRCLMSSRKVSYVLDDDIVACQASLASHQGLSLEAVSFCLMKPELIKKLKLCQKSLIVYRRSRILIDQSSVLLDQSYLIKLDQEKLMQERNWSIFLDQAKLMGNWLVEEQLKDILHKIEISNFQTKN